MSKRRIYILLSFLLYHFLYIYIFIISFVIYYIYLSLYIIFIVIYGGRFSPTGGRNQDALGRVVSVERRGKGRYNDTIFRAGNTAIVLRPYSSTGGDCRRFVGEKNKVSQSVSGPRSLSRRDLPDDNSLQLRVVNGGRAS